jgi:hypothetical protein
MMNIERDFGKSRKGPAVLCCLMRGVWVRSMDVPWGRDAVPSPHSALLIGTGRLKKCCSHELREFILLSERLLYCVKHLGRCISGW